MRSAHWSANGQGKCASSARTSAAEPGWRSIPRAPGSCFFFPQPMSRTSTAEDYHAAWNSQPEAAVEIVEAPFRAALMMSGLLQPAVPLAVSLDDALGGG